MKCSCKGYSEPYEGVYVGYSCITASFRTKATRVIMVAYLTYSTLRGISERIVYSKDKTTLMDE